MTLAAERVRRRSGTEALNPLETLLRELVAGQRQIIALLEQQRRPSHLTREDRDRLAQMLPVVGGVFGSELFLVRELFESEAAALRLVLRAVNAKQVGRLLRRGEGQASDGYVIQRDGFEMHAVLWRVVHVPEFSSAGNLTVSPRALGGLVK
jgi:hypothetical protein